MVIAINAVMFVAEMVGGQLADSRALQADALDFLGDTLTYGLSLAVIGRGLRLRASAAMFKALTLLVMGLGVAFATLWSFFVLNQPAAPVMGSLAVAALAANLASLALLAAYRHGDANVRSVWLCSRNDAFGNIAVMAAAGAVWLSGSPWPDLVVALLMASLFVNSAVKIFRQALAEWRTV